MCAGHTHNSHRRSSAVQEACQVRLFFIRQSIRIDVEYVNKSNIPLVKVHCWSVAHICPDSFTSLPHHFSSAPRPRPSSPLRPCSCHLLKPPASFSPPLQTSVLLSLFIFSLSDPLFLSSLLPFFILSSFAFSLLLFSFPPQHFTPLLSPFLLQPGHLILPLYS